VRLQRASRLGPDRPQRSAALRLQRVGDDGRVAHQPGDPSAPGVEEGASVGSAVRGDTKDFQGLAVIESAAHGPAGASDPDQSAVLRSAEGEFAADRRVAVPVVLGDELVGLPKVKGDRLQAVFRSRSVGFCRGARCEQSLPPAVSQSA
jgi:hypothetical protein